MKLIELATILGGELTGDGDLDISGLAPAGQAGVGHVTFAENEKILASIESGLASAILIQRKMPYSGSKSVVRVDNPRIAFAQLLGVFFPERKYAHGIHATAVIMPGASVHEEAHIGPCCVVESGAVIHPGAVLVSHVYVGTQAVIGESSILFPQVTIYSNVRIGSRVRIHAGSVVGSDGFGYVFDRDHHRKIPQVGGVIIEDDAEVGANVTIDRGTLGNTRIGRGTKIDNLVQIGHNVEIGHDTILVSQVGIAGSTSVGNFTVLAGQAGISGHLKIGNRVTVGPQSGVIEDIRDGETMMGTPAINRTHYWKSISLFRRLPEIVRKLRKQGREDME